MQARMFSMIKGAVAMALVTCLAASLAFAQIDFGDMKIIQNGVQVGEIYVGPRGAESTGTGCSVCRPDSEVYVEHWILYPNYVYPSAKNGVKTEILPFAADDPSAPHYKSEADFFARAPFGTGYRYIAVTANDSTHLPRP